MTANDESLWITPTQSLRQDHACDPAGESRDLCERFRRACNWSDRTRLLFQSMCDTDWSHTSDVDRREYEDDQDLIMVLDCTLMRESKYFEDFASVAEALPSSQSRKLDGSVSLTEMGALLAVIMIASTKPRQTDPVGMIVAIKSLLASLGNCFATPEARIGWEEFQRVTADNMVRDHFQRFR